MAVPTAAKLQVQLPLSLSVSPPHRLPRAIALSSQPARGLDRPSCEIAPPLESDRGSNRADPKMERSSRVVTLLTLGDPRINPRIAAHCRCLASRTIPAPCRTWINVFWATILLIRSSPDSCTCTRGSTRLST